MRPSWENCSLSKALSVAEDKAVPMPQSFKADAGKLLRNLGLLQMTQVGPPALLWKSPTLKALLVTKIGVASVRALLLLMLLQPDLV